MANYASKLIEIALAEVGYLEKETNKNLDSKTGNAGDENFTKYARDLAKISGFYNGNKNGFAWCDVFVDWCFVQAFGVAEAKELLNHGQYGAGCIYSAQYFRNINRFHSTPKIGDVIFFGTKGKEYHTGIVYNVDSKKVYTVEGNTSGTSGVVANGGGVFKKSYSLTNSKITGYGRPNYDMEVATVAKSIDELAQEVLDGKHGNGDARVKSLGNMYDAVQKRVNELVKVQNNTIKPNYQCIHVVARNDTLWALAKKYLGNGGRYNEIIKLNGLKSTVIRPNQKLKIPKK